MNKNEQKGIFINGKQQIVELLQYMQGAEKETLLRQIKLRNPAMAKELIENSLSFEQLSSLTDSELKLIYEKSGPAITGIALQNTKKELQRKILSLLERTFAEKAFEIMTKELPNGEKDIVRARQKVVATAITLSKQMMIRL